MNLIKFIWRTDRLLFYTPAFFIGVAAYLFAYKDPRTGLVMLLVGSIITSIILSKKAQHRRTLDHINMVALVREMIHNANTFPFALPQEDAAMTKVDELFDNPLK